MLLLIIYITLALGFSFLCSVLEAVLLSITPSYVALQKQKHPHLAKKLDDLKTDIDKPLAAILTLNTIAHTVGAAGAGAQATKIYGDAYFGLFSAILTLLILFVSEIIPKTLGALYWRRLAPAVAVVTPLVMWSMWPLMQISLLITRRMRGQHQEQRITRAEIRAIAHMAAEEGVVDDSLANIVTNLLKLQKLKVSDIMTPRTVLHRFSQDSSIAEVMQHPKTENFSRILIFNDHADDVVGYILKSDLQQRVAMDLDDEPVENLLRPLMAVPKFASVHETLKQMTKRSEHIAIAVDEYGEVHGVITMEDIFETLLGMEIVDEMDEVTDLQEFARKYRQPKLRSWNGVNMTHRETDEPAPSKQEPINASPPGAKHSLSPNDSQSETMPPDQTKGGQ